MHMCLLCNISPMHKQWGRVVEGEEGQYMCEIDLQCIHMSDEEPQVFQQFPDWK